MLAIETGCESGGEKLAESGSAVSSGICKLQNPAAQTES